MYIRIFSDAPTGLEKYQNFLRLETSSSAKSVWTIEPCDPIKWTPTASKLPVVSDLNIFVNVPVRQAIPWSRYNVLIADYVELLYAWSLSEVDLKLPMSDIADRSSALSAFRRVLRLNANHSHPPALPKKIEGSGSEVQPKVGIITVTRNRKLWWPNMIQNVLTQRWDLNKIEWILVDDGDDGKRLGKEVEEFMERSPGILLRYVEITDGQRTIGEKCNIAVQTAGEDVSVFVRMDDDDHYPVSSIENRVAWFNRDLSKTDKKDSKGKGKEKEKEKEQEQEQKQSQIVYCSMIPMYDVTRYISAMNVPDLTQSPCQRVSEATLAFTRAAWVERPFPHVSMAEGEEFLMGRESESVEIPCRDVIVSFIHAKNSSARRVPANQEPNGCHYGLSDEYFKFIHTIGLMD